MTAARRWESGPSCRATGVAVATNIAPDRDPPHGIVQCIAHAGVAFTPPRQHHLPASFVERIQGHHQGQKPEGGASPFPDAAMAVSMISRYIWDRGALSRAVFGGGQKMALRSEVRPDGTIDREQARRVF